jgi:hypothetical protein
MPFRTPEGARRDLLSLIDAELRQRLEEAVDNACLEAMVSSRRKTGTAAPVANDARDREEFTASVRAFLERLRDEIPAASSDVLRTTPEPGADASEEWRLLAWQIERAKALPDYWQRFEAVRLRFTDNYEQLRGLRRGVLGRLFGRA